MMTSSKRRKTEYTLFYLLLFTFAIYKTSLGIHSDEVHAVAVGDMIARGDSFFKECWFYLQMSAVFTAPIIWLYRMVVGSTDGILLFFRILSVLIQFFLSFYMFCSFKDKCNNRYLRVACVAFFTYVPDFQSFNYKQELIWFTLLEILFLYRYHSFHRKRYVVFAAIALSCSVLAFPTTVFLLFIWCIIVFLIDRENSNRYSGMILFCVTCLCCAIMFMSVIVSQISISDFIYFFPKVFQDENLNSSFLIKLTGPTKKLLIMGGCTLLPIVLVHRTRFGQKLIRRFRFPLIWILILFAFLGQCYIERGGITWHVETYSNTVVVFVLVGILLLGSCDISLKREIWYFFIIPSIALWYCISLASNQGNITCMYGTIFAMIGLCILLGTKEIDLIITRAESRLVIVTLLVISLSVYLLLVYEQESVQYCDINYRTIATPRTKELRGPAKGIKMGEYNHEVYNQLCDAIIDSGIDEEDRLLIISSAKDSSYGYLFHKGEYATFSPQGGWGISDSSRIIEYIDENPYKKPTCIIVNKDSLSLNIGSWEKQTYLGKFILTQGYFRKDISDKYVVYSLDEQ